jgi:hypothetical protein
MIKYIFCAFLPAAIALTSCGSPTNTENEQSPVTEERGEIPETSQWEEPVADESAHDNERISEGSSTDQTEIKNETRQRPPQNKKEIEKITVSFISIGEGIDYERMTGYQEVLENWKSAAGKTLSYESIGWGREGETDFCIDMTNISDTESKKFLSETRERFKDNSLVQIETNQECKESRIRK